VTFIKDQGEAVDINLSYCLIFTASASYKVFSV